MSALPIIETQKSQKCPIVHLGLHRRETGEFYPTDELGAATVIEVGTRGTLRSESW